MKRYIALLRGINVGGNNKVAMPQLRECFEQLGFSNVSTYINSGNVIFKSDETDKLILTAMCEQAIEKTFGFRVGTCIISAAELEEALIDAPSWWDADKKEKNNTIFVIPPATAQTIMKEVGDAKPEYEKVSPHGQILFWTAPLKTFSRTRYHTIVGTKAYQSITIRNANTTKKLLELA